MSTHPPGCFDVRAPTKIPYARMTSIHTTPSAPATAGAANASVMVASREHQAFEQRRHQIADGVRTGEDAEAEAPLVSWLVATERAIALIAS